MSEPAPSSGLIDLAGAASGGIASLAATYFAYRASQAAADPHGGQVGNAANKLDFLLSSPTSRAEGLASLNRSLNSFGGLDCSRASNTGSCATHLDALLGVARPYGIVYDPTLTTSSTTGKGKKAKTRTEEGAFRELTASERVASTSAAYFAPDSADNVLTQLLSSFQPGGAFVGLGEAPMQDAAAAPLPTLSLVAPGSSSSSSSSEEPAPVVTIAAEGPSPLVLLAAVAAAWLVAA